MSLPKNIQDWYQQFLQLARAEGIDVNSPASGSMFQSINISVHTKELDGEMVTEYRDDPVPLSAPLSEVDAHINDPLWLFENTRPIGQMTEAQIMNMYELAKEGKVVFSYLSDAYGEPKAERKIIYTGTDALPHFSGPLTQGPVIMDRHAKIDPKEMARVTPTFPNAPDPIALAEMTTHHAHAQDFAWSRVAMTSDEIDKRISKIKILGELDADRTKNPQYYDTPENFSMRSKIVASSIYRTLRSADAEIPEMYQMDRDYHYELTKGLERHILSVSTANMSLDEMIAAGLIRKEDGTPYTHGEKPWDTRTQLVEEVGKTIQVYRPGENGSEPQLDGTVKIVQENRVLEFKKTRTEKSAQRNEEEKFNKEAFWGVQAHKTVYGGVRIAEMQKKQLQSQPASEFLAFDKNPDGSFQMRYKLPEKGRVGDEEFSIRENMNYFMHGISQYCFDKNGNIDFKAFRETATTVTAILSSSASHMEFSETIGVPEEKREDFCRFMRHCGTRLYSELVAFSDTTDRLEEFQCALSELYRPGQPVDAAKEKFLMESYGDFQNMVDNIRKISTMDPETETHIYNNMDCLLSANVNREFLPMVNSYRENKGQPLISVPQDTIDGKKDISIEKHNPPDDPEKGYYRSFDTHACFVVNAKLNNKDVIISMETTAPPNGKILFSDSKGENAIGIYKDTTELENFHCKNSYYHIDHFDKMMELKSIRTADMETVPAIRGSHIIETKLRTAVKTTTHTREELGKRLSSWKVDSPVIVSSKQFSTMKECFEDMANAKTPSQEFIAMQKLNIAAQFYLDYKEPKGDAQKAADLSDYAKRRLDLARDILDYTSAKINAAGVEIPIVSEIKARKLTVPKAEPKQVQNTLTGPETEPKLSTGSVNSI